MFESTREPPSLPPPGAVGRLHGRRGRPSVRFRRVPALVGLLILVGCGDASGDDTADGPRRLLVSAAASLTDAFGDIGVAFEAAHPGVDVSLNLAGSATLRAQIVEGAPVDVFASADMANMERVAGIDALAGEARIFARNSLRIAVPAGNPAGVTGLADFERTELLLGLCAPEVPCGAFAREALARAGVEPALDTEEPDVRALLTKVSLAELDAAITYATDVTAAGPAVEGIDIPEALNVEAAYPIGVLRRARHPDLARALVTFVLSENGRAILARHGFGPR